MHAPYYHMLPLPPIEANESPVILSSIQFLSSSKSILMTIIKYIFEIKFYSVWFKYLTMDFFKKNLNLNSKNIYDKNKE